MSVWSTRVAIMVCVLRWKLTKLLLLGDASVTMTTMEAPALNLHSVRPKNTFHKFCTHQLPNMFQNPKGHV